MNIFLEGKICYENLLSGNINYLEVVLKFFRGIFFFFSEENFITLCLQRKTENCENKNILSHFKVKIQIILH